MKLFVWIFFLIGIYVTKSEPSFEGCKAVQTYGYDYDKFFPIEDTRHTGPGIALFLEFYVKSESDALILLNQDKSYSRLYIDETGYEIVIGGGRNSFSQIRRYLKSTKSTQPTKNILSPEKYNGFWIKVETYGVILVGRKGETEPFLFWADSQPIQPIRSFAFSSWTNIRGSWFYDCDHSFETEVGNGNVTAMYRLKNDLLAYYNPFNFPEKDGDRSQDIEMHLDVHYFHMVYLMGSGISFRLFIQNELRLEVVRMGFLRLAGKECLHDERKGELTLSGTALLKWMDWKLIWNSTDYQDIKVMFVAPYQIWTPTVRVMNSFSFEKKTLLSMGSAVVVNNEGVSSWRVPFHSITLCVLGYRNWPFDTHNCSLVFGFWMEPLKIDIKGVSVKVAESEWIVQEIEGNNLKVSRVGDFGSAIDINFCRRDPSFEFLLLPPYLGAAVLALVSFWLHPDSSIKLFLNCGSLLILLLMLMCTADRIPKMISAAPRMLLLYSWGVLVMCLPIVIYIALKYIPAYVTFSRGFSDFLNGTILEKVFCLPEVQERQPDYSHIRESDNRPVSAVRIATLIERIVFVIYVSVMMVPFLMSVSAFRNIFNF